MSGSGREANLLKMSAAVSAVKPMNSSAATLMVDCGRSKVNSGEELKLLKRTEAELLDERETLPWLKGAVKRAPLTFRLPEVDGILELSKTRSFSSACVSSRLSWNSSSGGVAILPCQTADVVEDVVEKVRWGEHLCLAQHRAGRLGDSDTMPDTAGGEVVRRPLDRMA